VRAFAGSDAVPTGVASYPADGSTAAALLARAAAARGRGEERAVDDFSDGGMRRTEALAARAAGTDIPVLILGESGSGKEVLARTIHGWSQRAERPLVAINCAAFSSSLLESELFGHERGAFTGATPSSRPARDRPGGTILLDEIGELELSLQAKLLRVIETREITRVGGVRPRQLDVRFIAATNATCPPRWRPARFAKISTIA
jgi:transcriptional regulator with PAS, ATPase and Fis domain